MRFRFIMAAGIAAVLSLPLVAQAQGIVRGAEEGAAEGNRAAGPVGGAVGGAVGGIVGGVEGVLGIPQRHGSTYARDRSDRAELTANQITNDFAARTARIKADLRLTPEQEKNWPGFESAMSDMGKRYGDRQTAVQANRTQQKAPGDVIEQLRDEAQFLSDRSVDQKTLADAAQPLYASLDDQQKRRFAKELIDVSRWPAP
ncbi:Spy/CpxP family protein refolding chaperone [Bradyrhizobium sp.]|jgi:gas vesicle protein|uniref:Spy/CpxP family protein refolding chaperone n=1 Tax=Bradyrhizobium sp. TaxID=376 RepID=UPI0025BCD843|nr:Spy/CpxP family protein refolding chaperone [Bradyrhizobium sp.]